MAVMLKTCRYWQRVSHAHCMQLFDPIMDVNLSVLMSSSHLSMSYFQLLQRATWSKMSLVLLHWEISLTKLTENDNINT